MTDQKFLIILGTIVFFTFLTILFYYKKDRYEPEPKLKLLLAFILGVLSIIPALIAELYLFPYTSEVLGTILIAPIVEEICKGIFVVLLSYMNDFDGPLDGFIYGAMVGSGFSAGENLFYGLSGGISIALLRSITQIIGHPFYTGLFGAGVGAYKVGMKRDRVNHIWRSIMFHSLWNTAASLGSWLSLVALLGVGIISIRVLRAELKKALLLDEDAFRRGYYQQKHQYREARQQGIIPPHWQPTQSTWQQGNPQVAAGWMPQHQAGWPPMQAVPSCMICRAPVVNDSHACPKCQALAHRQHLFDWVQQYGYCPNCRSILTMNDF